MINPFAGYRLAGAVGSKVFAEELPVRAGLVVVARLRVDLVDLVACSDGIAVDVEPPLLLVHRRLRNNNNNNNNNRHAAAANSESMRCLTVEGR